MPSSKYVIKCPDIVQGIFEHWLQQNKAHMEDWIDAINIVDRYPPELIRDLVNALPFTPLRPKQTSTVPEDLYILTPERLVTDLVFTLLCRTFHHNMVNFMTANPDLKGRALMADIEQRLGDMILKPVEVNGIAVPEETLYSCHFSGVDISDGLHGEYSVLELKLFQQRKHFQELAIWEGTEALFSSVPKFTLDLTYLVDMFGSSVIDIFSQRSRRFPDLSEGSIDIENQYASSTSTEGSHSNRGVQQQSNSKKSKGTLQVAHTSQQHTLEADMANLASPFDEISDDQEDMDVSDLDLGEPLPRLTNIPDNYPTIQMKTRKHSPAKRQPRAHGAPIVVPLIEHHDRADQTKGGKRTIELSSIVKKGGGMDQAPSQHSPQNRYQG
jgi:hypothetical protein